MNWWVLRRRPHVSWLIAILCVAILIGVYWSKNIMISSLPFTLLLASILLIAITFWQRYTYLIPLVIVGGVMLGLWRGAANNNEIVAMRGLYGLSGVVSGKVMDDVDSDASGQLVIRLNSLQINNQSIRGTLWVTASSEADIKRGDLIEVEGEISAGFGSFIGTMYRAQIKQVQRPQPGDIARQFRDWFADMVRRAIPDPESSLGLGYLVGQKRALPADLAEALKIAGLTHIVVASGYNLTILVRLARRLFEKVSKYLAALSASAMIAGFMAITGLSPSMTRAGLVASLSLVAWYYGRRFHPLVLLPVAAAITVLINPSYLWGDLGWQLSFAAFAGVMILAPLLQRFFFGDTKPSFIRQILGETISALIATAPILISAFGQISNVSIIANLSVLPLVPLAMLLTFVSGLGAMIVPTMATIIGLPATWLLGYMIGVAEYLSKLGWAISAVQLSSIGVSIRYGFIVVVCVYL